MGLGWRRVLNLEEVSFCGVVSIFLILATVVVIVCDILKQSVINSRSTYINIMALQSI